MTLFIHFKIHLGRRKLSKDNGLQQEEEFNDLMHGTGTETPNSVKVPTSLFDKATRSLVQKKW